MRRLWYITTKDLLQTRRDRLAALFTIVLPVIFTVVLGLVIGNGGAQSLPLALVDADRGPAAQELVALLQKSPVLDVQIYAAGTVDKAVQDQKVAAGLLIPAGFSTGIDAGKQVSVTVVRIQTSGGAQSAEEAIQTAIGSLSAETLAAKSAAEQISAQTGKPLDATLTDAARQLAKASLATPAVTVDVVDSVTAAGQHPGGFKQSSPGELVNWILFSLLTIAVGVVTERRMGSMRRLASVGVSRPTILGGKTLAMVIITLLQQVLLILLGQYAFHVDYFRSPLALILVMISLSCFAASLGLLISSLFRSEQAVVATTVICAMLLAALGGAWFPLDVASSGFSHFAHFLPTSWVIDSFHGIILKGWGVAQVLKPIGIVWAWVVVLFGLAVWRFRPE